MDRHSGTATASTHHHRTQDQLPRRQPSSAGDDATSSHHSVAGFISDQPDFRSRRPLTGESLNTQTQNQKTPSSSISNSQDTTMTTSSDSTDQIFTPAMSDGGMSAANGNDNGSGSANGSSQESQLMHLSHIAAAQEKMQDLEAATAAAAGGLSRKRMADGAVKHTRQTSSASPVYVPGHSRNTSAVSVASTTGSRIGELSAELKARLSYAMVKVNNGWQSHSIDEVETLASQAASPASSTSTIHGRHGSSASPQLRLSSHRPTQSTSALSTHASETGAWKDSPKASSAMSPPSVTKNVPSLAPPVSIQPSRPSLITRRNSNPRYTPAFLSHSHHGSPQTPAQPSPIHSTPDHRTLRTPVLDPILFSPHQNVREQDAIESLLFMSSPGNSANLKHNFPSSSQPVVSTRNGITSAPSPHRTALPSGQPRKSLPSGRPAPSSQPLPHGHSQPKRVGFDKSPSSLSDMDVDEPFGTPRSAGHSRANPRRKTNGADVHHHARPLSMSSGLGAPSRARPTLGDADIEQMLDRVAADDSSDSEGEIQIPLSGRPRREGASVQA